MDADVRYTLTFKPTIQVSGSNFGIHRDILTSAGFLQSSTIGSITSGTHFTQGNAANLFSGACFTIHTEPHNNAQGVPELTAFIENGGNFLAQCEAVVNYENNAGARYQTIHGITTSNTAGVLSYPNADLPYSQFTGVLNPAPGGSVEQWVLANVAGNAFKNDGHIHAHKPELTPNRFQATQSKLNGAGLSVPMCFILAAMNTLTTIWRQ